VCLQLFIRHVARSRVDLGRISWRSSAVEPLLLAEVYLDNPPRYCSRSLHLPAEIAPRSRRNRAEIAPRSRRDRVEIAPSTYARARHESAACALEIASSAAVKGLLLGMPKEKAVSIV